MHVTMDYGWQEEEVKHKLPVLLESHTVPYWSARFIENADQNGWGTDCDLKLSVSIEYFSHTLCL